MPERLRRSSLASRNGAGGLTLRWAVPTPLRSTGPQAIEANAKAVDNGPPIIPEFPPRGTFPDA